MLDRFSHFFFRKEMDNLGPRKTQGHNSNNNRVLYLIDGRQEDDLYKTEKIIDKKVSKKLEHRSLILGHQMMDAPSDDRYSYTEKDINWKGVPADEKLLQFIEEPYSLLIAFVFTYRRDFDYIIHRSNCNMKIGSYIDGGQYNFDIVIDLNNRQDPENLLEEIQHFCPDIIHYET
jgi:hypothetical protein